MPQSDRPYGEKSEIYETLQKLVDQRRNKRPLYILGDWNAILIYPISAIEEQVIGKHTMHQNSDPVTNFIESMRENRHLLVEFCAAIELLIRNTMFKKPLDNTATYRKRKESIGILNEPITSDTHEQLDYTLTTRRCKKSIKK